MAILLCLAARFKSSAQVANDDCSGAVPMVLDTVYTINTMAATSGNDPTNVCGGPFGRSVWFSLTPPRNGTLTLSTCGSDFDTAFQLYTGGCTDRVPFLCSDDLGPACQTQQASATFLVYSNVTYLVVVGGYNGAGGHLRIVASMPPPPNDQCSGAIPLSPGVPVRINTANATDTNDPLPECYGLTNFHSGVWYRFTPATNDLITIETATDSPTVMAVCTGTCANLTPVTCAYGRSQFLGTSGTTYLIFVVGYGGGTSGDVLIVAAEGSPPNDTCSNAIPMTEGITYSMNAVGATGGDMPASGCFDVSGVWYSFTPTSDSIVTVNTCGSDPGTSLQVYSGNCNSLEQVVDGCTQIHGSCTNGEASVAFRGTAGATYRILATCQGNLNIRATTEPILPNDRCAGALAMSEGVTYTAETGRASSDGDNVGTCYSGLGRGVWYTFTPTQTCIVTVSTCGSDFWTALQVFSGACGALSPVIDGCNEGFGPACASRQASVNFRGVSGTTYHILAAGVIDAAGNLAIQATTTPVLPNDSCVGALAMSEGVTYTADTTRASSDGDPISDCSGVLGKAVWYTFTPATNVIVTISTCGSDFDTLLNVFTGTCGSFADVLDGCNNNDGPVCAGAQASVSFKGTAGVTYSILAGGENGAMGNLRITTSVSPPLPNDDYPGAIAMTPGVVYTQSTTTATTSYRDKDVWYSFTSTTNCIVTISTCGSDYVPELTLFCGSNSQSQIYAELINSIAGPACTTNATNISFGAMVGVTYWIEVSSPTGLAGTLDIQAIVSPPLPNDLCSGAIALAFAQPYSESTARATSQGDPLVFSGSLTKGVWFTLTPAVSDTVTISTCGSDFDTILEVYSGTCDALVPITTGFGHYDKPPCDQGRATAIFPATANNTYYVIVGGFAGITGNLTIAASVPPPINSFFSGAIPLLANRPVVVNTSYGILTNQVTPDCGTNVSKGVWFNFVAATDTEVTLDTCGSDFPTVLQVYTGDYPSLQAVACNAGAGATCATNRASISFFGQAGTRYAIFVGGQNGASGNLSIVSHVPPPVNGVCSSAIALTNGMAFSMNTTPALAQSDVTPVCLSKFGSGVWFSYKPPRDGPIMISTCGSDFDTALQVYGGECDALDPLDCNDDSGPGCATNQASVSFVGSAQTNYLILAGGSAGAAGNLRITATRLAPLPNQDCASAIPMLTGVPYGGNTFDAPPAGSLPLCQTNFGHVLWYSFTPQLNGLVCVSTCGSDFDTVLQVYNGDCGSLIPVDGGCNDDAGPICGSVQASMCFPGRAGARYSILVGGYGTNWGNLEMTAGVVPQISSEVHPEYVTLSWPTNVGALQLEYTTNITPPIVWSPASYYGFGTNFTSWAYPDYLGPKAFFRLRP